MTARVHSDRINSIFYYISTFPCGFGNYMRPRLSRLRLFPATQGKDIRVRIVHEDEMVMLRKEQDLKVFLSKNAITRLSECAHSIAAHRTLFRVNVHHPFYLTHDC